mmetsp:Transcript_90557/g.180749  ORF Transcript_90557/g.180749 Transcript_90557/m.180749 type:complete len:209 (-) Transcript_90557:79-705(-)
MAQVFSLLSKARGGTSNSGPPSRDKKERPKSRSLSCTIFRCRATSSDRLFTMCTSTSVCTKCRMSSTVSVCPKPAATCSGLCPSASSRLKSANACGDPNKRMQSTKLLRAAMWAEVSPTRLRALMSHPASTRTAKVDGLLASTLKCSGVKPPAMVSDSWVAPIPWPCKSRSAVASFRALPSIEAVTTTCFKRSMSTRLVVATSLLMGW